MGKTKKLLVLVYICVSSVLMLFFQNCGNIVLTGTPQASTPTAPPPSVVSPPNNTVIVPSTDLKLSDSAVEKPITGSPANSVVSVNENLSCDKTAVYVVTEKQLFSSDSFDIAQGLKDDSLLRGNMSLTYSTNPLYNDTNYYIQISNIAEKIDTQKSFPQDCVLSKNSNHLRYVSHKSLESNINLGPNGEIKFCRLPAPAGNRNGLDFWYINVKVDTKGRPCNNFSYQFSLPGEALNKAPPARTKAKYCINTQSYFSWMDPAIGFKSPGQFGLVLNIDSSVATPTTQYIPHPNFPDIVQKTLSFPASTSWAFKASYSNLLRAVGTVEESKIAARLNPNAATAHGPWLPSGGAYLFNISDEPCSYHNEPRAYQCQTDGELKLKNPHAKGYFDELSPSGVESRGVCHLGKPAGWENGEPYWYVNFMPTQSLKFWGFTSGGNGYFPRNELDPR